MSFDGEAERRAAAVRASISSRFLRVAQYAAADTSAELEKSSLCVPCRGSTTTVPKIPHGASSESTGQSIHVLASVSTGGPARLSGAHVVSADIVEVAPADDHAELTGIAATGIRYEMLCVLANRVT